MTFFKQIRNHQGRIAAITVLIVALASGEAFSQWQLYRKDDTVIASVDYLSFASFHGQPSVWVRWHYVRPIDRVAGIKVHVTADCNKHKLIGIDYRAYDVRGNYLPPSGKGREIPKEYNVVPGSLYDDTYRLLCRKISSAPDRTP